MAPGATLIREPWQMLGHAAEPRRWHVPEPVGQFEMRLVVETNRARVFQSARTAPGTEAGVPAICIEAADGRGETMIAVVRRQVRVACRAVLVAETCQGDGAVMFAVTLGTVCRQPVGPGELQLMPAVSARRMADEARLVGRRADGTVRGQEAKSRRARCRLTDAALDVERRVHRRERSGLVRGTTARQERAGHQEERYNRRRQSGPHFRPPQRPRATKIVRLIPLREGLRIAVWRG